MTTSDKLRVVPCSLRKANDFVEAFHRHNLRTSRDGGKFAVAVAAGSDAVGVAIVGNPLSASLMDGLTADPNIHLDVGIGRKPTRGWVDFSGYHQRPRCLDVGQARSPTTPRTSNFWAGQAEMGSQQSKCHGVARLMAAEGSGDSGRPHVLRGEVIMYIIPHF